MMVITVGAIANGEVCIVFVESTAPSASRDEFLCYTVIGVQRPASLCVPRPSIFCVNEVSSSTSNSYLVRKVISVIRLNQCCLYRHRHMDLQKMFLIKMYRSHFT